MAFGHILQPLIERRDLTSEEASAAMRYLMSGDATDAQIGGLLIALRIKGCTAVELAAFATVMREHAASLAHDYDDLVDTCGTGGGTPTFNISTAAAIIACAAGVRMAKHGNRAQTSKCGSADVLEALGVELHGDSERLLHLLDTLGIVFLFAPAHHPAMRFVGPARKQLETRTVFNQLGPLANPAGAKRQLIGVYDPELMKTMAEALRLLGTTRALIVHGRDGLDEISPRSATDYVRLWDGQVSSGWFEPADFGIQPVPDSALRSGVDVAENGEILREAISDVSSPLCACVVPSAAAAIWLGGKAENVRAAADLAREAVESGAAGHKLRELIEASQL